MNHFLWDASALAKRYSREVGTPLVNRLFVTVDRDRMMCPYISTSEVISVFVRKKNSGQLTNQALRQSMSDFGAEVVNNADFRLISALDSLILASHRFIELHALNATDALILQATLEVATMRRSAGDDLVLIASDQRLLRAAQAEGLNTFNPETDSLAQLTTLL